MPWDVFTYLLVAAAACVAGIWTGLTLRSRGLRDVEARATAASNQLWGRLSELEADRTRMAAILSGMVEGVLVVDGDGRLRLVNDAARQMLNLEKNLLGRHYVEAVRQPGVVGQLGAALKGERRPPIEVPLHQVTAASGPRIFRKRRQRARRASELFLCCMTLPTCAVSIACAEILSQTSPTSSARPSRPCGATWKR
jgi:PAS domain-containing protein